MPVRPRATLSALVLVAALALALTAALLTATAGTAEARWKTRWDCLAHYESTNRWAINTGNGHYGGLQFSLTTWRYYGGPNLTHNAMPHQATRKEQIAVAKRVAFRGWKGHRAQGGSNAWPNTWHRCF
jgi:hypothetical protein